MRPSSKHSVLERHSVSSCSLDTADGMELAAARLRSPPKTLKASLQLKFRHRVQA
jgi:hypothetical protein